MNKHEQARVTTSQRENPEGKRPVFVGVLTGQDWMDTFESELVGQDCTYEIKPLSHVNMGQSCHFITVWSSLQRLHFRTPLSDAHAHEVADFHTLSAHRTKSFNTKSSQHIWALSLTSSSGAPTLCLPTSFSWHNASPLTNELSNNKESKPPLWLHACQISQCCSVRSFQCVTCRKHACFILCFVRCLSSWRGLFFLLSPGSRCLVTAREQWGLCSCAFLRWQGQAVIKSAHYSLEQMSPVT